MYRVTSVEDQQKFAVPLNRETENIYYNLRMIIDSNILTEPRAWRISKINRVAPNGILRATLAQDRFDQHKDYIELDDNGLVIGKWADFFKDKNFPQKPNDLPTNQIVKGEFSWSALPQIKVGGSYKKFTLTFYKSDEEIPFLDGEYSFTVDGNDVSEILSVISDKNIIKVKFNGDDSWIGKTLTIKYRTDTGIDTSVNVEIVGL